MDAVSIAEAARVERIRERQERIQKRLMAKRGTIRDEGLTAESVKPTNAKALQQVSESIKVLDDKKSKSISHVTNVRVIADMEERQRRKKAAAQIADREESVQKQSETDKKTISSISMRWADIAQLNLADELANSIESQRKACEEVLQGKRDLLYSLNTELSHKDDIYHQVLLQQKNEIEILIQRMNTQFTEMREAYTKQLANIENAFVAERKTLRTEQKQEIEQLLEARREMERQFITRRIDTEERNAKELYLIQAVDLENYQKLKVKLESDLALLQAQLQQMKFTYLLNTEKLEYNYRLLTERDNENNATLAAQKIRLSRLRSTLAKVQNEYHAMDAKFSAKNSALTAEYTRLVKQYRELQDKFAHFEVQDAAQTSMIVKDHSQEMNSVMERLLQADCIISEQILGKPWVPNASIPEEFLEKVLQQQKEMKKVGLNTGKSVFSPDTDDGEESFAADETVQSDTWTSPFPALETPGESARMASDIHLGVTVQQTEQENQTNAGEPSTFVTRNFAATRKAQNNTAVPQPEAGTPLLSIHPLLSHFGGMEAMLPAARLAHPLANEAIQLAYKDPAVESVADGAASQVDGSGTTYRGAPSNGANNGATTEPSAPKAASSWSNIVWTTNDGNDANLIDTSEVDIESDGGDADHEIGRATQVDNSEGSMTQPDASNSEPEASDSPSSPQRRARLRRHSGTSEALSLYSETDHLSASSPSRRPGSSKSPFGKSFNEMTHTFGSASELSPDAPVTLHQNKIKGLVKLLIAEAPFLVPRHIASACEKLVQNNAKAAADVLRADGILRVLGATTPTTLNALVGTVESALLAYGPIDDAMGDNEYYSDVEDEMSVRTPRSRSSRGRSSFCHTVSNCYSLTTVHANGLPLLPPGFKLFQVLQAWITAPKPTEIKGHSTGGSLTSSMLHSTEDSKVFDDAPHGSQVGQQARDVIMGAKTNKDLNLAQLGGTTGVGEEDSKKSKRGDKEVIEVWERMLNIIPPSTVRVWNALENGLIRYRDVMAQRQSYISEVETLSQTNAELRMLLNQYLNTPQAHGLHVHPAQTITLGAHTAPTIQHITLDSLGGASDVATWSKTASRRGTTANSMSNTYADVLAVPPTSKVQPMNERGIGNFPHTNQNTIQFNSAYKSLTPATTSTSHGGLSRTSEVNKSISHDIEKSVSRMTPKSQPSSHSAKVSSNQSNLDLSASSILLQQKVPSPNKTKSLASSSQAKAKGPENNAVLK